MNYILSSGNLPLILCGISALALILCFSHTAYKKFKDYNHDPKDFFTDGDNVTNNPL